MISPQALGALRVAATLTHGLPGLRARVRLGDEVLLDVVAADREEHPVFFGGRVISPCAFRRAVAHAHRDQAAGAVHPLLHLPAGADPAVELAVPPTGVSRPGGLYRVPLADRWLWALGVTLDAPTAHLVGADLVEAAMPIHGVQTLGIRPDPVTGVSVAFAETTATPGSAAEADVVDLLESLLARWTVHELVAGSDVSSGAHDPRL
jgi:hypothetical protein